VRARVRTWVMHGCLLGWFWNGGMLPWDGDVDVMVGEVGMRELAGWWNMTVHAFSADALGVVVEPGVGEGEEGQLYLIDKQSLHSTCMSMSRLTNSFSMSRFRHVPCQRRVKLLVGRLSKRQRGQVDTDYATCTMHCTIC
jgi:hypothetical protein